MAAIERWPDYTGQFLQNSPSLLAVFSVKKEAKPAKGCLLRLMNAKLATSGLNLQRTAYGQKVAQASACIVL